MTRFADVLRGYAFETHQRDRFRCVYCGLDGTASFEAWLSLTWDHLLPWEDVRRNEPQYVVTACGFCNEADPHYFKEAEERGLSFEGKTPAQLVEQRRSFVASTRKGYRQFWEENVRPVPSTGRGETPSERARLA